MTHTEPAHEAPKIVVEPLVRAVQLAPLAEAIRYVSDFLRIEIRREVAAARMEVDTLRAKIEAVEKMFDDAAIEVEPPWHSAAQYEAGRSHALRWAASSIRAALAGAVPGSPPEPAECPTCAGQTTERGIYPDAATGFSERPCEDDWHDNAVVPGSPETRSRRYDQCDDTCTVDCGHCKGKGRPAVGGSPETPSNHRRRTRNEHVVGADREGLHAQAG